MSGDEKNTATQHTESVEAIDCIFIGTSPLFIMEASYQVSRGKTVLMIDNNDRIGGSWCPVDIFGLHDVENAIHYFLQDPVAFDYMRDVLGWNITKSEKKYRVLHKSFMGVRTFLYDNLVGRMISQYRYGESGGNILSRMSASVRDILKTAGRESVYIGGGSIEIMNYVRGLVTKFKLNIRLSTQITSVRIEHEKEMVFVTTTDKGRDSTSQTLVGRKLFLSHGTRLDRIDGSLGEMLLDNKIHPRPAAHILVNDTSSADIHELIFMNNPLIKYVHDVTQFTREGTSIKGKQKVLVFALQHDVTEHPELYKELLTMCKENGMLGKNVTLEGHHWWDIYLPALGDDDLIEIYDKYQPIVEWLSTENFTKGIGLRSTQWASALK